MSEKDFWDRYTGARVGHVTSHGVPVVLARGSQDLPIADVMRAHQMAREPVAAVDDEDTIVTDYIVTDADLRASEANLVAMLRELRREMKRGAPTPKLEKRRRAKR